MGWIKLGSQARTSSPQEPAANTKLEGVADSDWIERAEAVNTQSVNALYPILPKRTSEKDLPYICPEEVMQRDGKDDNGLCTNHLTGALLSSVC